MRKLFLGATALGFVVTAGCSDERAITTEPVGDVAYGQNLLVAASNLPRGRATFPATSEASATPADDELVLILAGLDSLSEGAYTVWVTNDSATKFARVTGDLDIVTTDTSFNEAGDPVIEAVDTEIENVDQFRNGGQNKRMTFTASRAQMAGLADTDSLDVVLISIESGTPGAEPGAVRPLWARRSQANSSDNAGLNFGNFKARLVEEYVYSTSTTGAVPAVDDYNNTPRGRIEVRGDVFTVNDSNYYRPPVGYYYKAWAIKTGEFGVFVDTVSLGDKASPYPRRISFRDADTSVPDPVSMFVSETPCSPTATECRTQQPVIFASQHRVRASDVGAVTDGTPWLGFAWTYVTLEPKAAPDDVMGSAVIMSVGHPGSISGL